MCDVNTGSDCKGRVVSVLVGGVESVHASESDHNVKETDNTTTRDAGRMELLLDRTKMQTTSIDVDEVLPPLHRNTHQTQWNLPL